MQTIGKRRFILVLAVIGLIYLALIGNIAAIFFAPDGGISAMAQVLAALLSFVGGFAAGVLSTRGQDNEPPDEPKA